MLAEGWPTDVPMFRDNESEAGRAVETDKPGRVTDGVCSVERLRGRFEVVASGKPEADGSVRVLIVMAGIVASVVGLIDVPGAVVRMGLERLVRRLIESPEGLDPAGMVIGDILAITTEDIELRPTFDTLSGILTLTDGVVTEPCAVVGETETDGS